MPPYKNRFSVAAEKLMAPYQGTGDTAGAALSNVITARGGDQITMNPLSWFNSKNKVSQEDSQIAATAIEGKTGISGAEDLSNLDHYLQNRQIMERLGPAIGQHVAGASNLGYTLAKRIKQSVLGRSKGESKATWAQYHTADQAIKDVLTKQRERKQSKGNSGFIRG